MKFGDFGNGRRTGLGQKPTLVKDRYQAAKSASDTGFEGSNFSLLIPPAYSLMRPQYESLVRGIWLLHAASDSWVEKLGEPLTLDTAKRANEGLMLAEMLEELEKSSTAPRPIVDQLKEYRDVTWKALNSYAHGGLHPLSRTLACYPAQLTYDVVRNSNAVVALATQLVSILSGDPRNMEPVRKFHVEYSNCLPILR